MKTRKGGNIELTIIVGEENFIDGYYVRHGGYYRFFCSIGAFPVYVLTYAGVKFTFTEY